MSHQRTIIPLLLTRMTTSSMSITTQSWMR